MHQTWDMYFYLNEPEDLAFEMGGMLYALGYYKEALDYFKYSVNNYGQTPDVFYNKALCYYQLRQDDPFLETIKEAKIAFPDYQKFQELSKLDLGAA
jgi:tetratricopeptide (TPR) repeat protein